MMTGLITRIAWLYYKEGLKESQIATMLDLSRSKVGRLIKEVGESESSDGRKPTLLDFNYDYGVACGIKIEVEKVIHCFWGHRGGFL